MTDMETVRKTAERAFILMERNGVEPTVPKLMAWLAYAEKIDPRWNEKLDQLVANQDTLATEKVNEEICHFLLGLAECRQVFEGVSGLFSAARQLSSLASEAETNTEQYSEALREARGHLDEDAVPPPLRQAVTDLISATDGMIAKQKELAQELEEASHEIALLRNRMKEAHHKAITDPLTQAVNEKYFFARLREITDTAEQTGKGFSLVVIDIDGFRKFRDQHGEETGQRVLKFMAGMLAGATRDSDVTGRIGSNEFGLILPKTAMEDAHALADRVRDRVGSRVLVKRGSSTNLGRITVSAGITRFGPGETADTLIQKARWAMKKVKGEGGNKVLSTE